MNHYLYSLIALDIARDRQREAELNRRAALAGAAGTDRPGVVRRGLASGFAFVSRSSASAVRRLDECAADDLGRALAAAK